VSLGGAWADCAAWQNGYCAALCAHAWYACWNGPLGQSPASGKREKRGNVIKRVFVREALRMSDEDYKAPWSKAEKSEEEEEAESGEDYGEDLMVSFEKN
jgi:hypothetical protein